MFAAGPTNQELALTMTDHRYHHYYWKLANRGRSKQLWQTEQEAGGGCRLAGLATVINELRWSEVVAEANKLQWLLWRQTTVSYGGQ